MEDIEDIINYFTGVIEMHGDNNDKEYWNTVLKERQSDKERIKELEKENKKIKSSLTNTAVAYADSISKSLIKEKIEKLKETADEDNLDDFIRIQVLEEILKEEK